MLLITVFRKYNFQEIQELATKVALTTKESLFKSMLKPSYANYLKLIIATDMFLKNKPSHR